MLRAILTLSAFLVVTFFVGCTTVDDSYGYSRPYVPRVSLPMDLDRDEHRLLPEIADVLEDAGYRTTSGGGAEYYLEFSVEVGPINADVSMNLLQGRREVARAYARAGGARTLFRREQRIRNAFEQCLREFESQIPEVSRGSRGGRAGRNGDTFSRDRRDRYDGRRSTDDYEADDESDR